jgi:ribosomal protein L30
VCKSFIKIEQTGSPIRRHHRQRETLIGLGLNRIGRVTHVPNTPQTRGMIANVKHLVRVVHESAVVEFISEDDLKTFEGWLRYQAIDPLALTPDELAQWRAIFDKISKSPTPKSGLMKLRSVPGEHRYAVAVREGSDLWLTLWVRRSPKGEFFVMVPRADRGWDAHVSYHLDGTFHSKSYGRVGLEKKLQPLMGGPFRGTEHLGAHGGYGPKSVGAVCDPVAFSGVLEVQPGILGPRDGTIVVDLVEPNCEPIAWPFVEIARQTFKDALPWVVIRVGKNTMPNTAA